MRTHSQPCFCGADVQTMEHIILLRGVGSSPQCLQSRARMVKCNGFSVLPVTYSRYFNCRQFYQNVLFFLLYGTKGNWSKAISYIF